MKKDKKFLELRQKAQAILKQKDVESIEKHYEDIEKLTEELNIYQIELEMQNKELQATVEKLSAEQKKYRSLYMEAPTAYFTLNKTGNIIELNRAAADMLNIPYNNFRYTSIFPYLEESSKRSFLRYFKRVFDSTAIEYGDLVFLDDKKNAVHTNLSATTYFDEDLQEKLVRCTVVNKSKLKEYQEIIRNQERLNETILRYKSIFSATNAGIAIADAEAFVVECNTAFADMLGYTQAEIYGKYIGFFSPAKDFQKEADYIRALTKTNNQVRLEKTYIKKNGDILYADLTITAVFFDDKVDFYVGIFVDITDRKKAKQATTESEKKYRELFEANLDSITVFELDKEGTPGKFIAANKHAATLVGYKPEEVLQKTPLDVEVPVSAQEIQRRLQQFQTKGMAYFQTKLQHKNGSLLDVEVYVTPVNYNNRPAIMNITRDISERKKADKKLKEQEEQFRTIFNASPQPMIFTDLDTGKIIAANEIFFTKVNAVPAQVIGKTTTELKFYSPSERQRFVSELIEKGRLEGMEMNFRTLNGRILVTKMFSRFINVNDKRYVLTIFEDITEQKKIEEEVQMLTSVVRQSPSYIVVTDLEGKIEYVNPAFTKTTGYTFEEVKNKNPRILKSGEVKPEVYKGLWETITNGTPWWGEFINKRKIGEHYVEKVVVSPIKNQDGEIIKYFAIKEDITERIEMEQALKESEEKFKAITSYAKDAIILIDDEDTVKFWNKAAETIFQYQADEVIGKKMHPLILPSRYGKQFREGFLSFQKTGNGAAIGKILELNGLRKSGDEFPAEISVSSITIKDKLHAIGIIRDITERKQAETQLNDMVEELKNANATKDKFFNIIAHDLKNPFNSILGFSDLLANNAGLYNTEKIQKFAQTINTASKSTYKLLENLLEWSRAQTGKINFDPQNIVIENMLIEIIGVFENMTEEKNIHINYSIAESLLVYADKNMLNTILRNLISNAIKFTPRNGEIIVKAFSAESGIEIQIIDNGIGMNEENKNKLFKIHEKISQPGTENEKGTGLGLLLCKEFIERHGGKISVESKVGQGSTFSFKLPHLDGSRN